MTRVLTDALEALHSASVTWKGVVVTSLGIARRRNTLSGWAVCAAVSLLATAFFIGLLIAWPLAVLAALGQRLLWERPWWESPERLAVGDLFRIQDLQPNDPPGQHFVVVARTLPDGVWVVRGAVGDGDFRQLRVQSVRAVDWARYAAVHDLQFIQHAVQGITLVPLEDVPGNGLARPPADPGV